MARHRVVYGVRRYPRPNGGGSRYPGPLRLTATLEARAWREHTAWLADETVRLAGHRPREAPRPRVPWEDWHPDRRTRL